MPTGSECGCRLLLAEQVVWLGLLLDQEGVVHGVDSSVSRLASVFGSLNELAVLGAQLSIPQARPPLFSGTQIAQPHQGV
ncbi:hypothetical protein D9M68_657970 [compost metagenome]